MDLLRIQTVQLCKLKQAHFIIMELCHSGLKALVMNNYGTAKEHGRIQNKEGVWRGQLSGKQVCAMNYTSWRNAATLSGERVSDCLLLAFVFAVTKCVLLSKWIQDK